MTVKTSVETENEVTKNIKIEIPRAIFDEHVAQKLGSVTGRVQLKGFRKGKVPKNYVNKLYGNDLKYDVLNDLISEHYRAVIDKENLQPVGLPDLDINEEVFKSSTDDIQVIAKVSLFPNPEINNYKNIEVTLESEEQLKEEDVEKQLQILQNQFATFKELPERNVVELKDMVKVDYIGFVNGKKVEELCADNIDVEATDDESSHPVTRIVGAQVGSVKEVDIDIPKGIKNNQFSGKTIVYKVTIKAIQEKIPAELNDELAKKSEKAQTLDELKEVLRAELAENLEEKNKKQKLDKILEEIVKLNPFLVPQKLIDDEIRRMLIEFGFLSHDDESVWRRDVSMFRDKLGETAEQKVRHYIIFDKLKKTENITVTDDELDSWYEGEAKRSKLDKGYVKQYYETNNPDLVKRVVENDKIIDLLISSANIK
jgi:trigger factor